VIPFWLVETHYVMAWGTVNDLDPALFFVDTGLEGAGFTSTESILEQAGIQLDWNLATTGIGGGGEIEEMGFDVDRLTLGSGENEVVKTQVPGSAIAGFESIMEYRLGFYVGGLISHSFFSDHALTFDFTNMQMILQEGGLPE